MGVSERTMASMEHKPITRLVGRANSVAQGQGPGKEVSGQSPGNLQALETLKRPKKLQNLSSE